MPREFIDSESLDGLVIPGGWRKEAVNFTGVTDSHRLSTNTHAREVAEFRDRFANFFVSPAGSVPWQNQMISSRYNPTIHPSTQKLSFSFSNDTFYTLLLQVECYFLFSLETGLIEYVLCLL